MMEEITFDNPSEGARASIMGCPKGLMHYELLKNCLECPPYVGETKRDIRVFVTDDNKIAIINSGLGMDADTLVRITNLSSTTKILNYLNDNRGEGAKIACLNFNHAGMRYRSRRNGIMSQVTLIGHNGKFGREHVVDDYGNQDVCFTVLPNSWSDEETKRYTMYKGDFTEVVLYGMNSEHNVHLDPYYEGKDYDKQYIPNELFMRFYRFADIPGLGTPRIRFSEKFRGGSHHDLLPIGELVERFPDLFLHADDRFRTSPRDFKIEYIATKLDSKGRRPFNCRSMGRNGGVVAFVYKNEMYETLDRRAWQSFAAKVGLAGLSPDVSVLVHLSDDAPVKPSRYRDYLEMLDNKDRVTLDGDYGFAAEIFKSRPQWLVDMANKKMQSNGDVTENISRALKKFQMELQQESNVQPLKGISADRGNLVITEGGLGKNNRGSGERQVSLTPNEQKVSQGAQVTNFGRRKITAEEGMFGSPAANQTPIIRWWSDPEETGLPDLVNRAATYSSASGTIDMNERHNNFRLFVTEMMDHLESTEPNLIVPDTVRSYVIDKIKEYTGIHMGKYVIRALKQYGRIGAWSRDEVFKEALSKNTLTVVFNNIDLGPLKNNYKDSYLRGRISRARMDMLETA